MWDRYRLREKERDSEQRSDAHKKIRYMNQFISFANQDAEVSGDLKVPSF